MKKTKKFKTMLKRTRELAPKKAKNLRYGHVIDLSGHDYCFVEWAAPGQAVLQRDGVRVTVDLADPVMAVSYSFKKNVRTQPVCSSGKQSYQDKKAAEAASRWFDQQQGQRLSTYRCPVCKEWHLTSTVRRSATAVELGLK